MVLFYACFGLFSVSAAIASSTSYLTLEDDYLEFREDFKRRRIEKHQIEEVTWEKGCSVSVKLLSGEWVDLPGLGQNSQGLTNSVRAWLRRVN